MFIGVKMPVVRGGFRSPPMEEDSKETTVKRGKVQVEVEVKMCGDKKPMEVVEQEDLDSDEELDVKEKLLRDETFREHCTRLELEMECDEHCDWCLSGDFALIDMES